MMRTLVVLVSVLFATACGQEPPVDLSGTYTGTLTRHLRVCVGGPEQKQDLETTLRVIDVGKGTLIVEGGDCGRMVVTSDGDVVPGRCPEPLPPGIAYVALRGSSVTGDGRTLFVDLVGSFRDEHGLSCSGSSWNGELRFIGP